MNTYDSVTVAKYMLALAYKKGIVLNTTKVQKLLYIVYGHFLAKHNHVLITEEPKAWPYGPVFPRTRKWVNYDEVIKPEDESLNEIRQDNLVTEVLENVIDKYSKYTATKLSDWSHAKGGPWDRTTKQEGFSWSHPIPNEYIKEYFCKINI